MLTYSNALFHLMRKKAPYVLNVKTVGIGTSAALESGNGGTYDLANNQTLLISVDGGTPQTITFVTGDFVDIDAATADEVVTKINASLTGAVASVTNTTYVTLTSSTGGSGSKIQVTGGTANTALGFDTTVVTGTAAAVDADGSYGVESVDKSATGVMRLTLRDTYAKVVGCKILCDDKTLFWTYGSDTVATTRYVYLNCWLDSTKNATDPTGATIFVELVLAR